MDETVQREDLMKKLIEYKPARRKKVERHPGDKKSGICPRCGGNRYDFEGRFKHCRSCGFHTFWELRIKIIKGLIKHGRMDEVETNVLAECVKYINQFQK